MPTRNKISQISSDNPHVPKPTSANVTLHTKSKSKRLTNTNDKSNTQALPPIYYQNIRGIPAKENLFRTLGTTFYKIVCLTETWFTEKHKTERYIPSRFTVFRLDRNESNSEFDRGGLAILVDAQYKCARLKQFENPEIEGMCVEIKISRNTVVIYLAYVPEPNSETLGKHAACIEQIMNSLSSNVLVMGDFNMSDVKWQSSDVGNHLIPRHIPNNSNSGFSDFLEKCNFYRLDKWFTFKMTLEIFSI